MAEQFAQTAERDEHRDEAGAGRDAREQGLADGLASRDGVGLREQSAIRHDQRNEQAEALVQIVEQRVAQEVDTSHERRDDQHVERNTRDR